MHTCMCARLCVTPAECCMHTLYSDDSGPEEREHIGNVTVNSDVNWYGDNKWIRDDREGVGLGPRKDGWLKLY